MTVCCLTTIFHLPLTGGLPTEEIEYDGIAPSYVPGYPRGAVEHDWTPLASPSLDTCWSALAQSYMSHVSRARDELAAGIERALEGSRDRQHASHEARMEVNINRDQYRLRDVPYNFGEGSRDNLPSIPSVLERLLDSLPGEKGNHPCQKVLQSLLNNGGQRNLKDYLSNGRQYRYDPFMLRVRGESDAMLEPDWTEEKVNDWSQTVKRSARPNIHEMVNIIQLTPHQFMQGLLSDKNTYYPPHVLREVESTVQLDELDLDELVSLSELLVRASFEVELKKTPFNLKTMPLRFRKR